MQITETQVLRALGKNQDKLDGGFDIFDDGVTIYLRKPYVFADGWSSIHFEWKEPFVLRTIREYSRGIRTVDLADWRS